MTFEELTNFEALVPYLQTLLTSYGLSVVGAIAILLLGWWLSKLLTNGVQRAMRRAQIEETLISFITSLLYMGALALVVIATLNRLGVNTTSFAAVIAAAGLAIGLALQGSLSNFAAGVMLIFFRPFRVGDFIEAAGVSGSVEEIRVFSTRMRTADNKVIVAGNSSILNGNITNYSAKETRRVDMVFGIGYDDDIRKAKEILQRLFAEDERVLAEPAPMIVVLELADSSVNLGVRPWVKTEDYWKVLFDFQEKVKLTFDAEGISFPFPQRDVHLLRDEVG